MSFNAKNHKKTQCFLVVLLICCFAFEAINYPRRDSNDCDSTNENTGNLKHSENGGTPGGTLQTVDDSTAGLKAKALEDLQQAWKAIRRMETLSDDRADAKAAERALSFVDKAFAELERGTK